jgi:hypothetical protein
MSEYQAPIPNPLPPMPAPVAPTLDSLPIPAAPVPDLPPLPAPSVEAIATAHSDMMDGDLTADAAARARLGLDGGSASIDSRVQYGTPENGAAIYGGGDTQSGTIYGGAELALTDAELRAKLAGSATSGPSGTQGDVRAVVEGGDDQSAAKFEAGMNGIGQDPNLYAEGDVRIGDPDAFNLRLSGQGDQLTTKPQGTIKGTMGGPIAPGVTLDSSGHITTDGQTTTGGGGGNLGIQTPAGTINVNGHGSSDGSGGGGILFDGQF